MLYLPNEVTKDLILSGLSFKSQFDFMFKLRFIIGPIIKARRAKGIY